MRPHPTGAALAVFILLSFGANAAHATQVTDLTAFHRSGQTFITWTSPPGTGWVYRIYASPQPIETAMDFSYATQVGYVGDSSACDHRYSSITGVTTFYRVDSLAAPLDGSKGLFVVTPDHDGSIYYAVTAELGTTLDLSVTMGGNSLTRPIIERQAPPQPVFQQQLMDRWATPLVYTIWTTNKMTYYYPAMANVPGIAFDFAVHQGGPAPYNSLCIDFHERGGYFLRSLYGTGTPGEWYLSLDDPIPNSDANTFWYGYHESYDITSDVNEPPVYGVVHDYTLQRSIYTIEWALNRFQIDRTKVYTYGYSMGGIGGVLLAFKRPDLVAAVLSVVGKFDFSFLSDPNPDNAFNPGGGQRITTNKLWGDVNTDLPTNDGISIYDRLNDGRLAGMPIAIPPILAFNGRNDVTVGWAEKIPFYHSMRDHRQGGLFFWDMRDHMGTATSTWGPAQDPSYLYRFRTNRSFPALSNCSIDNDPGDGSPASGDTVGCINCFVEWDTLITDEHAQWVTRLSTHDVNQRPTPITAPESLTVDVTPRRLQQFRVVEGTTYHYTATRLSDGAVVLDGSMQPDDEGLITVIGVPVYHAGTELRIVPLGAAGVGDRGSSSRLQLSVSRNPLGPSPVVQLSWPRSGPARVELLDVAGRVVRTLVSGNVAAGPAHIAFNAADLENGVYFVVASQSSARASTRVVALR